jgi:hypothetical protein
MTHQGPSFSTKMAARLGKTGKRHGGTGIIRESTPEKNVS